MTTASSPSRTAMVTVSLVRSLKRSQTGLAQRRMSGSALTALASRTSPKPSLYFSVAASCSTSPLSQRREQPVRSGLVDLQLPGDLGHTRPPAARQELHNGYGPVDRLYRGAPTYYGAHKRRSYTTLGILARSTRRPRALPPLPSLCVRWLATTPKNAAQAHSRVGEEGSWARGWTQGSRSRWWLRCFSRPRLSLGSRPDSRATPQGTSPFYVS